MANQIARVNFAMTGLVPARKNVKDTQSCLDYNIGYLVDIQSKYINIKKNAKIFFIFEKSFYISPFF